MSDWVKVTNDEFKVGIEIATLKKGELQIKYAKDIVAKDKEIERLNNIINELEKDIDLELYKTRANDDYNNGLFNAFRYIKDKLQELKGDSNE